MAIQEIDMKGQERRCSWQGRLGNPCRVGALVGSRLVPGITSVKQSFRNGEGKPYDGGCPDLWEDLLKIITPEMDPNKSGLILVKPLT